MREATLVALLVLLGLAVVQAEGTGDRQESPLIVINGRAARPAAPPIVTEVDVLVWLRDLSTHGLGSAEWDAAERRGSLSTPRLRLDFRAGSRQAGIITRGDPPSREIKLMPHAAVLSDGKLMVPLRFVCRELGVSVQVGTQLVVELRSPSFLSTDDRPTPGAEGGITGHVMFAGKPLGGIVLRLVRDADFTFLRERRAVSRDDGGYGFASVPPGRYRVYAYVGDNRDYFNRQTAPITVEKAVVRAPPLVMGQVLHAVRPAPHARVPADGAVLLQWTECREASQYELSVVDAETSEEVALRLSSEPSVEVAIGAFIPGRHYEWQVLALGASGEFLGSSPGAGAVPWTFVVLAGVGGHGG